MATTVGKPTICGLAAVAPQVLAIDAAAAVGDAYERQLRTLRQLPNATSPVGNYDVFEEHVLAYMSFRQAGIVVVALEFSYTTAGSMLFPTGRP